MHTSPIPVDLILHATAEALHTLTLGAVRDNHPDDAAKFAGLRHGLSRAVSPQQAAAEWDTPGHLLQVGAHIARIAAGDTAHDWERDLAGVTRAIEIAIARRLADTACALRITGDAEDAAQAVTLWRAAEAITGLAEPPVLTGDFPRGLLKACAIEAAKITGDAVTEHPAEQAGIIGAALRTVRDKDGARPWFAAMAEALGVPVDSDLIAAAQAMKAATFSLDEHGGGTARAILRDAINAPRGDSRPAVQLASVLAAEVRSLRQSALGVLVNSRDTMDLATIRGILGADAHNIVAVAKSVKEQADQMRAIDKDRRAAWAIHNTLTSIIGGADMDEVIANAKAAKALAVAALWMGTPDTAFTLAELVGEVGKTLDALRVTAGRRLHTITEHDKQDAAIAEELGARDDEDNLAAAERVKRDAAELDVMLNDANRRIDQLTAERDALKGRDPCETCRNDRRAAIAERDAVINSGDRVELRHALGAKRGETPLDAAKRVVVDWCQMKREKLAAIESRDAAILARDQYAQRLTMKQSEHDNQAANLRRTNESRSQLQAQLASSKEECDAAIESRAQMQAKLVAVERERDAAQEEAKVLRVGRSDKRPQPGDEVPWAEANEDGCLYFDGGSLPFYMVTAGLGCWQAGPGDSDIELMVTNQHVAGAGPSRDGAGTPMMPHGILVARGLSANHETWRRAMREWTDNGNRPLTPARA
jgi:hypothetical protein